MESNTDYKEILDRYVIDSLYPELITKIDLVFPTLEFKDMGNKWISPLELDGGRTKSPQKDRTFILKTPDQYGRNRAIENGGDSVPLIDLYININGGDYMGAVESISKILGLDMPRPERGSNWEEKLEKEKALEESYKRQRAALYSGTSGANKALQYLREVRNYKEDIIKGMEWGYLTKEESLVVSKLLSVKREVSTDSKRTPEQKQKLDSIFGVGREGGIPNPYYREIPDLEFCTLDYRDTQGKIIGFKLYPIQTLKEIEERGKRILQERGIDPSTITPKDIFKEGKLSKLNAKSLNSVMNKNPFGLNLVQSRVDSNVVIVESETDTRHAKVKGLNNWIATSGGSLGDDTAQLLQRKGIESVTLFFDLDKRGKSYTRSTIETLNKYGIHTLVAQPLPDGYKDPEEYLIDHTGEELERYIKNAETGYHYLYRYELEEYNRKQQETPTERNTILFLEAICKYIANIPEPVQRASILEELSRNLEGSVSGIREALREKVASYSSVPLEEKKENEDRRKRNEDLRKSSLKKVEIAKTFLEKEDIQKASSTLQEATDIVASIEEENKYQYLLEDNTEELWESYKTPQRMFYTRILLQNAQSEQPEIYLAFPSGAISLIGSGTNHGKSKVLQSITLDALEQKGEEGTILYITYEENEQSVNKQFLNAFANLKLTTKTSKFGNLVTISNYLYDGDTKYMGRQNNNEVKTETQRKFFEAEKKWKEYRKSGRIKIIKPEDNDLDTFLGLVRYAATHIKVRAVLVDYVQELYIDESKGKKINVRTEELKEIMIKIDLLAQKYDIPIIMAAQLDRKLESPKELANDRFADSGWLERKSSEIVLMYSNKFRPKDDNVFSKLKTETPYCSLYSDDKDGKGKMLFKLTKSRYNPVGHTAICKIDGNTGRVEGNLPKDTPTPTNSKTRQQTLELNLEETNTPKTNSLDGWRKTKEQPTTTPVEEQPLPFERGTDNADELPF